jgi:hypothetical protein
MTGRSSPAWKHFAGHIQDMGEDERVFMLGALTGALERRLPAWRVDSATMAVQAAAGDEENLPAAPS